MKRFLWLALLAGTLASPTQSAPAPPPRHYTKNLAPADVAGEWDMLWDGEKCPTTLSKDGGYRCEWKGSHYIGWWRCQHGRLEITEAVEECPLELPQPDQFYSWVVPLQRDERGQFDRRHLRGQAWYNGATIPFELRRATK
jgi:hypothetical protein